MWNRNSKVVGEVEFFSGLGLSHCKTNLNFAESGRDLPGVDKNLHEMTL